VSSISSLFLLHIIAIKTNQGLIFQDDAIYKSIPAVNFFAALPAMANQFLHISVLLKIPSGSLC
jgi:hypothetical protein